MKNLKLLLLIAIIFLTACSSIPSNRYQKKENYKWKEVKQNMIIPDLQAGDIIVKEKQAKLESIFGHAAIMKNDRIIADYPISGETSYYMPIDYWLEEGRKILILRYKDMNEDFKQKLIENMKKYFGKEYKIHLNRLNTDGFYCSQYIWYVFYITANEMGFELDLDSDGGYFIFPYDLINSPHLEIVK